MFFLIKGFFSNFLILFLFFFTQLNATTYYSKASGNWNSATTWGTSCGAGTGSIPVAGDNVIICSTYTINISSTVACDKITINSGGTLNMTAGTLAMTNNASGKDLTIEGIFNLSGGEVSVAHFTYVQNSGIFNISGTASFVAKRDVKLRTVKGTINMSGGTAILQGELNCDNAADEINQTGGTIQFDNTSSWVNTGKFNATGGLVIFNGNTTLNYVPPSGAWNFFDLTINAGKTFDQKDAANINVRGSWTNNNGTYTPSNTAVTFNGSAPQFITGTSATTFDSLIINNNSNTGVTLLKPTTIASALTLIDGYVYTDAINLIIISNNATSTSGSNASFVSGPIKKVGNDPFVFPVGSAGTSNVWARLEMVDDASFLYYNGNTEFTCQYYSSAAPYNTLEYMSGTMRYVSYVEYWDLERTFDVANNAQCNVRLYWENATRSGITDNDHLFFAHFNSSAGYYQDHLGVPSGGSSGYITSTAAITSFSPFTFASDTISTSGVNPLPIELLMFSAKANGSVVALNWITASETNNDYFTIESTIDGLNFEVIGIVKGAGNSSSVIHYSFVDNTPLSQGRGAGGEVYYRLKQTDYDGHSSYSDLEKVNFEDQSGVTSSVYPNPSDGNTLNLILNNLDRSEEALILVQDVYGNILSTEVIAVLKNSENVYAVDFSQQLIPGVYLLTVTTTKETNSTRFIVN